MEEMKKPLKFISVDMLKEKKETAKKYLMSRSPTDFLFHHASRTVMCLVKTVLVIDDHQCDW